ncbi:MAG: lamin tail domain-containing protein [bacterium]|nr:lamin tail domain-containing protein [bacterium]
MPKTDKSFLKITFVKYGALLSCAFSIFALTTPFIAYGATFSAGSLLRASGAPEVYILEDGMRRWVPDPETFNALGFNWDKIRDVPLRELKEYPEGDRVQDRRRIPNGVLLRSVDSPKVYVIENGRRRWVPDPQTFNSRGYSWENINLVNSAFFKNISEGVIVPKASLQGYSLDVMFRETPKSVVEGDSVQFRFFAPGVPSASRSGVSYETFLPGFDTRWISVRQETLRRITLKKGGDYIFYVRARSSDGRVSAKPISFSFVSSLSPYWKQVKISSVTGRETNPAREYIQISNTSRDPISLEGWSVEGDNKLNHKIPRALDLPRFDTQDLETSVVLGPGERLTLLSGTSPVFSDGFHINKCFGYMTKSTAFYPALSASCPRVDTRDLPDLAQACRDYIQKIPACTIPQNITDTRITEDSACLDYLRTHFSYAACLKDYQFDGDFYGAKEWRGYLGLSRDAWGGTHDRILLRDESGRAVYIHQY